MKRRLFIAINLPEIIKKKLGRYQDRWPELPVRWIKFDNLHITLEFLGYFSDEELPDICNTIKGVALRHQPFVVNLKRISYGPPKKTPPRMVWVEGEKSRELGDLKEDLRKSLVDSKIHFSSEDRNFSLHITLGRIRVWEWRKIEPEERPEIEEGLDLNFEVNSIELMESQLKRGGPEYTILESCPFKEFSQV